MINMSSSIATANTSATVSTMATAASNLLASLPGRDTRPQSSQPSSTSTAAIPAMTAQFREIHKNTWLKRLTAEGKKICVGPKVSLKIYCNLIGNYIYIEHFKI